MTKGVIRTTSNIYVWRNQFDSKFVNNILVDHYKSSKEQSNKKNN